MRHSITLVTLGVALLPAPALAQRAGENAVASADDAFGSSVGTDSTGIYNDQDTRGFSPLKAGNARLDGIYFDPVATVSGRLRGSYGIRVGIAANDYAFPAPTGIVDNRLRTAGDKFVASLSLTMLQYKGDLEELDFQIPLVDRHLSLGIGFGHATTNTSDGAVNRSLAFNVKPVLRLGGAEISPFYAGTWMYDTRPHPIYLTSGALVPPLPKAGHYLGQSWVLNNSWLVNGGFTAKVPITSRLALRAGLFRSGMIRKTNFAEVFSFASADRVVRHRLIADSRQEIHSTSGEAQLALKLGDGQRWQHRLIAGFRSRDRHTESGGSDFRDFGLIDIDGTDPEPEPVFSFSPVNVGRVQQSSMLLGYQGRLAGVGHANFGLQRARYRAFYTDARTGLTTKTRDDTWLYNATLALDVAKGLEVFAGTQRGLEDSGAAPENAVNRNEQLPTTRSSQYEAGLRWKFGKNHLVVSAFQITKPYFSFDGTNRYVELGSARYRGAEVSLVGHLDRLTLLAGAVALKPEVSGPGRTAGLVGERPAGTPDLYGRVDLQYRTDILGGLTPTMTLTYTGKRAIGSAPVAALGGRQSMLGSFTQLDFGLRHRFQIGEVPASMRLSFQNVLDHRGWKVVASNSLLPEETRRVNMTLSADF